TGDYNDRTFRLLFFGHVVNVIGRAVRKFQIEKNQIEFLLVERSQRFLDAAHHHAAKPDLFQEELKQILQTLVIIDHQDSWLSRLVFFENILVERRLLNAPAPADLYSRQLAALN